MTIHVNLAHAGMRTVRLIRAAFIGIIVTGGLFSWWAESRMETTEDRAIAIKKEIRAWEKREGSLEEALAELPPVSDESRNTLRYLASLDLGRGREAVSMLELFEEILPEHVALTHYTHDRWSGVVRLSGVAESAEDVSGLMLKLENVAIFQSVKLERQETAFDPSKRSLTSFEISCRETTRGSR